jgi:predicted GNAT family acetyltransferase
MCSTDIGDQLLKISDSVCRKQYDVTLAMDYMITDKKTEDSSDEVIWASADDVDEIFDCCNKFFKDCGLPDKPSKDNLRKNIGSFAILKETGTIVSMASCSIDTDDSYRITHVYTRRQLLGD